MTVRRLRRSCQVLVRCAFRYWKHVCVIVILWIVLFNLLSRLSNDSDSLAIRSDFHDISNENSAISIENGDSMLDELNREMQWGQHENNRHDKDQVEYKADVLETMVREANDPRPIHNEADNLLDVEDGIGQGRPMCNTCMGVNEVGKEIFDQSRLNKSLLRKSTCRGCFKNNFRYVIKGDAICDVNDVQVLFLITSSHQNFLRRSVLRNTWLTFANKTSNIRHVFIVGEYPNIRLQRSILAESEKYGDIVKMAFLDTYKNLTLKTMMSFKWAARYCPQAKYVMKTDDDVFVNIPSLLRMFSRSDIQGRAQRSIFGNCYRDFPNRYVLSKYYASFHDYVRGLYPRFCSGTGYITSMRVVRKLNAVSPNIPFFHLEDVYVGLCTEVLRYSMIYVSGFRLKVLPRLYSACVYTSRSAITTHARIPNNIYMIWKLQCAGNVT